MTQTQNTATVPSLDLDSAFVASLGFDELPDVDLAANIRVQVDILEAAAAEIVERLTAGRMSPAVRSEILKDLARVAEAIATMGVAR